MNLNIHTYIWKLQKRVNQRKGRIDCYRDKIRRRGQGGVLSAQGAEKKINKPEVSSAKGWS